MIDIKKYLDPDLIVFLEEKTRDQVLEKMVQNVGKKVHLEDDQVFYQAILDREKIVSTGIGLGVAIPHAKLASFDDFFISIAIVKEGVDWQALDGSSVRMVFMIGGPDDKQTEYLQLLSTLTALIKDDVKRKKLLNTDKPQEVLELLFEDPIGG